MKHLLYAALALTLVGCTAIHTTRLDAAKYPVKQVCIEENTDVSHIGVLRLLETTLQERGINSLIFRGVAPTECEYILSYSAGNGWDLTTYLRSADFRILKGGTSIAEASYFHAGGFDFSKFASAEKKLTPVFDALFVDFKRTPAATSTASATSLKYNEIRELKKLLDEGLITEAEFQREKTRVLSNPR